MLVASCASMADSAAAWTVFLWERFLSLVHGHAALLPPSASVVTGLSACSRSAGQAQPPRLHCWPCVAHPAAPHHLPPAVSCPQPSAGCLLSLQCGSSPASGLHLLPTRPEAGGTGLVLLTVSRMPAHLGCCCRACASWVVMGCLQVIVSSLSSV